MGVIKMNPEELIHRFTYHAPDENQKAHYALIRSHALRFAEALNDYCRESRELSLAITHLEEAVFWANAALARHGLQEADADDTEH